MSFFKHCRYNIGIASVLREFRFPLGEFIVNLIKCSIALMIGIDGTLTDCRLLIKWFKDPINSRFGRLRLSKELHATPWCNPNRCRCCGTATGCSDLYLEWNTSLRLDTKIGMKKSTPETRWKVWIEGPLDDRIRKTQILFPKVIKRFLSGRWWWCVHSSGAICSGGWKCVSTVMQTERFIT